MAFTALVVLSTLFAVVVLSTVRPHAPLARRHPFVALLFHPYVQFLAICGLLFVNQIACDAYIIGVHKGDPSFIAKYLGPGWFDISRDPLIRELARHASSVLAPSVLRVQAFLELPFTLFAYLAVARLLGRDIHRTLVRPAFVFGASISFTIAFSLVELSLANPYTHDDLVLRVIAMIVAPLYVMAASRIEGEATCEAPRGLPGLVNFLVGAAAIATIVLVVYDSFLLYNLAHLGGYAIPLFGALALATAATFLAPRLATIAPSPAMRAIGEVFASFTLAFFVPSLALRYWASHPVTMIAGAVVIAVSIFAVARRYRGRQLANAFASTIGACTVGGAAAITALTVLRLPPMPEASLAGFTLVFLVTTIGVIWVIDRYRATS